MPTETATETPSRTKLLLLLIPLIATIAYLIYADNSQRLRQRVWPTESRVMMGTTISITIRGVERDVAKLGFIKAFERAHAIDKRISTYRDDSEISAINNHFAISAQSIELTPATAALITASFDYGRASHGAFDVTVKPLINLWRHAKKTGQLPSDEEIAKCKPAGINSGATITDMTLNAPQGSSFGFGAIGKGYTADMMAAELEALGIYNYIIDVGRDLLVRGQDAPWRIGIQDPLTKNSSLQTLLVRSKTAVATSGDYEQQYRIDEHLLTHIIDPRSGWPIKTIAGATVIAPSGSEADALATAFTVLDPAQSLQLAEALTGVEVLILQRQNEGLKHYRSTTWPQTEQP